MEKKKKLKKKKRIHSNFSNFEMYVKRKEVADKIYIVFERILH